MEMAQIARERDLLASRLDDALHTSMLSAPIPLHGPSTAQPSEYPTLCAIPIYTSLPVAGRIVVKREAKITAVKTEESVDRDLVSPRKHRLPPDNTIQAPTHSASKPSHDSSANPPKRIVIRRDPKITTVKTEDSADRKFVTPRKRRLPQDIDIQAEGPPSKMSKWSSTKTATVSWPPGTRKVEVVITRQSRETASSSRNVPLVSSGSS
ncbi:hypothetical protein C8J57DRAFT_621800 [Mycena rebaudengoi]|nr:hypothetical protein C8J57DRAFT_621800 [Mycena rebaudengoi]